MLASRPRTLMQISEAVEMGLTQHENRPVLLSLVKFAPKSGSVLRVFRSYRVGGTLARESFRLGGRWLRDSPALAGICSLINHECYLARVRSG